MAGVLVNEGENRIANILFDATAVDSNLYLGLFTNSSGLSETSVLTDITEPTGGSYARKTLARGDWTVTNDTAAFAQQTFTATGSAFTGSIYGYFIATTADTSGVMYGYEIFASGPYTINQNDSIKITPNITVG